MLQAAKVMVDLAQLQDDEVGDGTTSVVLLASELLRRAHGLVRDKIHPTSIITGYRLAMKACCICICIYVYICIYIYMCMYVYVCICMYVCMYMYVCMCVCVCVLVCV
jgi:hypothetical protein